MTGTLPAIRMHNQVVGETTRHKILGVIIGNNLSWSTHIAYLCKVISATIFPLPKIKHFLNFHARNFFHGHIQACLDYGSTLWDLACVSTLKPLVSLHRRKLKQILLQPISLTDEDNKTLYILTLKLRFELNKGIFMYNIVFECEPPYLEQLFQVNRSEVISNTPGQPIHQLLKDLQLLPHECTVVLQWILAHCGIPGNERADRLAKSESKPLSITTYQEAKTLLRNSQKCQRRMATGDCNPSTDPIDDPQHPPGLLHLAATDTPVMDKG